MADPRDSRVTVEGFRVLRFRAELPEELREFIERVYQPRASMRYWQRLLGLDGEELEDVWKQVPWSYRKAFEDIAALRMPKRRSYVRFPLMSWTLKDHGADLRGNELVVRVYRRAYSIPLPERGLGWLRMQEEACRESGGRLTRYVAIKGEGEINLVLHCSHSLGMEELLEGLEVIAVVDINSSHGFYLFAYDLRSGGFRIRRFKIPKVNWRRIKELQRAAAKSRKPGAWATARCAQRKAYRRRRAALLNAVAKIAGELKGRRAIVFVDVPFDESLRGNGLQRTLRSFAKKLENALGFHGVLAIERTLPSKRCPLCGSRLEKAERRGETRVMKCTGCGRAFERDSVPVLHALKLFIEESEVEELAEKLVRHYRLSSQKKQSN
ncbi:transposase [Infirmifilum sp. NZ]|uniref:transposase n=1 Tax=Infirmifilum sp. NZ TaxID=2926850 RepID=UPI0027A80814|nr:transposase [Infirmifilum sp. NZ]UNQ73913.1 transposase [Infirmifilum sp. NZ]